MTTTFAAIRLEQIALVEPLVPTLLSAERFRVALDEQDLRSWSQQVPESAFRRFSITDLRTYESPLSSGLDTVWAMTQEEILVAYPTDYRYGLANRRALEDLIEADAWQIDKALGIHGRANYSASVALSPEFEREDLDGVTISVFRYRIGFYRTV